jgi:hypothetical protein
MLPKRILTNTKVHLKLHPIENSSALQINSNHKTTQPRFIFNIYNTKKKPKIPTNAKNKHPFRLLGTSSEEMQRGSVYF